MTEATGATYSGIDALFAVLDEDRNLPGPRALEDSNQLLDGLLEDMRWADVDLGDDNHDRDIKRQGNPKVLSETSISGRDHVAGHGLSLPAHAYQAVVRRDHQQTVVWAAAQQAEHGRTKISLVPREVGEANHFGLSGSHQPWVPHTE